jgi:hypothetical protein
LLLASEALTDQFCECLSRSRTTRDKEKKSIFPAKSNSSLMRVPQLPRLKGPTKSLAILEGCRGRFLAELFRKCGKKEWEKQINKSEEIGNSVRMAAVLATPFLLVALALQAFVRCTRNYSSLPSKRGRRPCNLNS